MSFTAPALLIALGLLAPVLIAFLVRRSRVVVRVPSTLLYRLAGAPRAASRRFARIKRLLALAACLLAVTALVVAAARPHGARRGETVVFVVDVSASMGAGGRAAPIELARTFVSRSIARGGAGDDYAIIAAGATPVRLAGPAAPGPELDRAIERLAVERGSADLESAIELAASLVAGDPSARVVVLGDGGESAGAAASVRDVPVMRRTFAAPARDNVGIAAFATRAAPDGRGDEREASITVATSSDRPRAARVTLRADGHALIDRRVDVPARGEVELRARVLASMARLVAEVRADDGVADAITADDAAQLDAAARRVPRVILLAPAGDDAAPAAFFAERALTSAGVREIVRSPVDLAGVTVGDGDVVVALDEAPDKRLDAPTLYLGTHRGALPFGGLDELTGDATRLRSLEPRDPLLRGVSLDGVTIERARSASAPSGARALVDLDGGTVLLAGGAGRGAWVYLGIDAARSDLVLRVAFPVLMANALHALAGGSDVVVADAVARSEITLRAARSEVFAAAEEPEPRLRLPASPPALLALSGALLLALEAWAFRKGWAS